MAEAADNDRARRLATAFQAALAAGIHPSGCFCGGMFRASIDAASLEQDVLDYLVPRYEEHGPAPIASLLRARQDQPDQRRFTEWLRHLPQAGLSDAELEQLTNDLESLLDSFVVAAQPAGGSRFACT